jgi:transcriptional regulator GlxA family with amidase domain
VSQSGVPSRAEQFITVDRREALRIASELVVARINHPNGPQSTPQLARMLAEVSALADHLVSYIQTGVTEPLSAEEVQKLREVVMSTEV